MKNIVFIGFMGTGKTTIATKIANRLNRRYVSIDDLIEKREKRTINEIFTREGEEYFRDVESQVIKDVSSMEGLVIDAGGGVVIRPENIDSLRSGGIVICLTADEDSIIERTKKYKHRPLLNVEDPKRRIRELMAARAPHYSKADHFIDTGKLTINQAVDAVMAIAEEKSEAK